MLYSTFCKRNGNFRKTFHTIFFKKLCLPLFIQSTDRNICYFDFCWSKSINAQSLISPHRSDFFLKINKRTCLFIRDSIVLYNVLYSFYYIIHFFIHLQYVNPESKLHCMYHNRRKGRFFYNYIVKIRMGSNTFKTFSTPCIFHFYLSFYS